MEKQCIYWDRADNSRIAGKQQIHNRLAFDSDGRARLYVFSTCRQFIRTFPCLVYSSSEVEDVDTSMEDHIYDELRYMCMERPVPSMLRTSAELVRSYDPLDTQVTEEYYLRARYR